MRGTRPITRPLSPHRPIIALVTTAALLVIAVTQQASADVRLTRRLPRVRAPALFSEGMVLQRGMPAPVFGQADPGEAVTVRFAGQEKQTVTDETGEWLVTLDPLTAGGPHELEVSGLNTIVVPSVWVGEVWVASGQSNMNVKPVRPVERSEFPSDLHALRRRNWGPRERPGRVPFLFGAALQEALDVPVGILNLAVGGTVARDWIGVTGLEDPDPAVAEELLAGLRFGRHYDRKIAPVQPFAMRGVVYWQGESDDKRSVPHRTLFPAVIRSWRREWGAGDFPFIYMQVPTGRGLMFGDPVKSLPTEPSASDRHAFRRHTFLLGLEEPVTSMVTSTDIEGGLHPKNREDYAGRLADHVLALVYGHDIVYSGPLFSSMQIEGNKIRVRFRAGTADGLQAVGGPLQGFAVSADNETWVWAESSIENDSEVVVWSDEVPSPVAARYAWGNRPRWANLFNGTGLGATPFATDAEPGEYQ